MGRIIPAACQSLFFGEKGSFTFFGIPITFTGKSGKAQASDTETPLINKIRKAFFTLSGPYIHTTVHELGHAFVVRRLFPGFLPSISIFPTAGGATTVPPLHVQEDGQIKSEDKLRLSLVCVAGPLTHTIFCLGQFLISSRVQSFVPRRLRPLTCALQLNACFMLLNESNPSGKSPDTALPDFALVAKLYPELATVLKAATTATFTILPYTLAAISGRRLMA